MPPQGYPQTPEEKSYGRPGDIRKLSKLLSGRELKIDKWWNLAVTVEHLFESKELPVYRHVVTDHFCNYHYFKGSMILVCTQKIEILQLSHEAEEARTSFLNCPSCAN